MGNKKSKSKKPVTTYSESQSTRITTDDNNSRFNNSSYDRSNNNDSNFVSGTQSRDYRDSGNNNNFESRRSDYNGDRGGDTYNKREERIERTVVDRRPVNFDRGNTDTNYTRSSERSDYSRNFSRSSSDSSKHFQGAKSKTNYDIAEFRRSYNKKGSFKNPNNSVTIERYIASSNENSRSVKQKGLMPMLKTNKAYDISFTLGSVPIEGHERKSGRKSNRRQYDTVEYLNKSNRKKEAQSNSDRTENWLKTDRSSTVQFEDLMKDINMSGREGDGRLKRGDRNGYGYEGRSEFKSNEKRQSNVDDRNADYRRVSAEEVNEIKEWMVIEYPDQHQEKREFRRETNEEGDVNYVDVLNGNILKVDKASWKSGEELVRENKGSRKIRYDWRKDPNTDSWVKYNSDTSEILKRGDWKSGSEWVKNSKGKLQERPYKYVRNPNGQWMKVDPSTGKIIDYSNTSAVRGHDWVPVGKQSGKKFEDKRWKKREYKYVQNDKGKWDKIDQGTMKKIGKSNKKGWKEGTDYHMDKNGKVKKVKYAWDSKPNGQMDKINKKSKEPVNTVWKEGRETVMRDNNINTTNYAWTPAGKNKWVKINQENGAPISKPTRTKDISFNSLQNQGGQTSYATRTSKHIENDKIIQEDTRIEQNNGSVIKNTTRTTQYVK